MKLSLSHWYPGSGVVFDCLIFDICPLSNLFFLCTVIFNVSKLNLITSHLNRALKSKDMSLAEKSNQVFLLRGATNSQFVKLL